MSDFSRHCPIFRHVRSASPLPKPSPASSTVAQLLTTLTLLTRVRIRGTGPWVFRSVRAVAPGGQGCRARRETVRAGTPRQSAWRGSRPVSRRRAPNLHAPPVSFRGRAPTIDHRTTAGSNRGSGVADATGRRRTGPLVRTRGRAAVTRSGTEQPGVNHLTTEADFGQPPLHRVLRRRVDAVLALPADLGHAAWDTLQRGGGHVLRRQVERRVGRPLRDAGSARQQRRRPAAADTRIRRTARRTRRPPAGRAVLRAGEGSVLRGRRGPRRRSADRSRPAGPPVGRPSGGASPAARHQSRGAVQAIRTRVRGGGGAGLSWSWWRRAGHGPAARRSARERCRRPGSSEYRPRTQAGDPGGRSRSTTPRPTGMPRRRPRAQFREQGFSPAYLFTLNCEHCLAPQPANGRLRRGCRSCCRAG